MFLMMHREELHMLSAGQKSMTSKLHFYGLEMSAMIIEVARLLDQCFVRYKEIRQIIQYTKRIYKSFDVFSRMIVRNFPTATSSVFYEVQF